MIVRTIPHSGKQPQFRRLIEYLAAGARKNLEKNPMFPICENLEGDEPIAFADSFRKHYREYLPKRKKSVKLYHEIINLGKIARTDLSVDVLYDIAKEYINYRTQNNPALCYANLHWGEKDLPHIHFVFSARDIFGKTLRQSRKEFITIRKHLEQFVLDKYPVLIKERLYVKDWELQPNKEKNRLNKLERLVKADLSQLEKVKVLAKECLKQARTKSGFYQKLQAKGLELYCYREKITGIKFENKKYRFKRLDIDMGRQFERSRDINIEL